MRKSLGAKPYLFPMPVLMIATYNEQGKVDVMNMAWGGICDDNMVALNISEEHQTAESQPADHYRPGGTQPGQDQAETGSGCVEGSAGSDQGRSQEAEEE